MIDRLTGEVIPLRTTGNMLKYEYTDNESGSVDYPERVLGIDPKTDEESPVPTGRVINRHEMIQSFRASTELSSIIARFPDSQISVYTHSDVDPLDLSDSPGSLLEVLSGKTRLESQFERLPLEERKAADFNFNKWVKNYYRDLDEKLRSSAKAKKVTKGVVSNEQNSSKPAEPVSD